MSAPLVRVRALSWGYGHGAPPALRGVSLELGRGERVGLVGPNGAGKSTLLLHLAGALEPTAAVEVDGLVSSRGNLARIRERVGLVFQDADDQLFMPTVFDDVAFGPLNQGLAPDLVRLRVAEALESVGLPGFEDRSSHHLSGGEKRRLALATVLAMRPPLLVLDEPASNLDARGRRQLVAVLFRQEAAMLLATHDLALVGELCTRCVVLDAGRVVADGPAERILADDDLLARHGLV